MTGILELEKNTSGYFTIGGTKVQPLESVTGNNWATVGAVDGQDVVLYSTATQTGIVDSVGGYSITLGGAVHAASISTKSAVYGTSGNDSVSIGGMDVELDLGSGNDTVVSGDVSVTGSNIKTGAGADSIVVLGDNLVIDAGTGDDSISVSGTKADIAAGTGNDHIIVLGDKGKIDAGDGNDYVEASITGGTLDLGAGNDVASVAGNEVVITGGAGNDSISVGGKKVNVDGGAGNDSIFATGESATLTGGDGNDVVSVSGANADINAGAGDDTISVVGTGATVDAGTGDDYVVVAQKAEITLGDGKDTVSIGAASVELKDYTYGTDAIILGDVVGADTTAPGKDLTFTTEGVIGTGDVSAKITATDGGYYKAALSKTDGTANYYAWAGTESSTIDLSSEVNDFYVNTSINGEAGDVITGGRGDDTVFVGSNDTVNGGRGADSIVIAQNAENVTVALSTNGGADSVVGASLAGGDILGFDGTDLTLYVDDESKLGFTFDGAGSVLRASVKGATAEFANVTATSASNHLDLKVNVAGTTKNYEIVQDGAVVDDQAQVFYGVAAGTSVSVGAGVSNTYIDLSNAHQFGDTLTYVNVDKIDAAKSTGEDVFITGADATTVVAGTNKSTIFGAGAKGDSIVGGDGDDTFVFGIGYGNDTVANYGKKGDDTLFFLQGVSAFEKDSDALYLASGSDTLKVQNVTEQGDKNDIKPADIVYTIQTLGNDPYTAKVGVTAKDNTFSYDEDVQYYLGGNKTDTVEITDKENHEILLGGTYKGTTYSSVEVLDASQASGELLIWGATDVNDTIKAGTDSSTIFGGFGAAGNDVLVGNEKGTATFEFGLGCGNDTIKSSKAGDSIFLYNASVSDLDMDKTAAATTSRELKLVLTDGSTLTVSGTSGANTLILQDSTWTYNSKTGFTKVEA